MSIDSICYTILAQRNEIVKANPKVVAVLTVLVVVEKIRRRRYNSMNENKNMWNKKIS